MPFLARSIARIEVLAEERKKRNWFASQLLEIEKMSSRMPLFQMEGNSCIVCEYLLLAWQKRVLIEYSHRINSLNSQNRNAGDSALHKK